MTAPPQFEAWYALRHLSNRAFAVREALRRDGVEVFLPTYQVETRWSDRMKKVDRPLFPGYIFARFKSERAEAILRTRGVYEILSIDQQPEAVPDLVIANLQRLAAQRGARIARCPYVAGVMVTVLRGPFAGVAGVVTRTQGEPGHATLTIPVQILGRAVSVEIEAADVREVAK